ncbi:MAG: hypothetical protein WCF85_02370 [Rhodospirillaceae bacterium]
MATRTALTQGLDITALWSEQTTTGPLQKINHTLCRLGIACNGTLATRFVTDKGDTGDRVEVPAYYLAEWLAVNWWAIFHEPIKSDDESDTAGNNDGFQERHWIGAARNGFSLPDLWLVPVGDEMQVDATSTYLSGSRLKFLGNSSYKIPVSQAKISTTTFVNSVISRLKSKGLLDTELQEVWSLVEATNDAERTFCERIGALGLSPYNEYPEIEKALDLAAEALPDHIVRDLCEAATPENFVDMARWVSQAFEALNARNAVIDFSEIPERPITSDPRPWSWGKKAATILRDSFSLAPTDPSSGKEILSRLGADPKSMDTFLTINELLGIEGALDRLDDGVRLVIASNKELPQRLFAMARALFLGWGAGKQDARLITRAHTAEQQASRAFAAELLAPIAYIRSRVGSGIASNHRLGEIAHELGVSLKVIFYQAQNNHLSIAGR